MGSSSIRMWDLGKYFRGLSAINRGFGGSCIRESAWYIDRIAAPYRSRLIVLYAGDNDVAASHDPELVVSDFEHFMDRAGEYVPGTPVIYVSIKPSPARWEFWPRMRAANEMIRSSCERIPACRFVDVASPMIGADGRPRSELFQADGLHMTDPGYRLWSDILAPLLNEPL